MTDLINHPSKCLLESLNGQDTSSEVKFVKETFGTDIDVDDLVVQLSTSNVLLTDRSIEHFNDLIKQMKLLPETKKTKVRQRKELFYWQGELKHGCDLPCYHVKI